MASCNEKVHILKATFAKFVLILGLFIFLKGSFLDAGKASASLGLPALEDSKAFRQFMMRPMSDLSKLMYLIDRLSDANIEIRYDNYYYDTKFAARLARWFLARFYRGETAEQMVMHWCNTSFPSGKLIWVRLPDGSFRLSREILLEELRELDSAIEKLSLPQNPTS
ncbi:MAG: hypothetical protein NC930_08750 [Candidatus Omnitrophica bacterium]|nr:hypothetical protein [Candidatus Omnitrophota bacterium]